MPNADSSRIDHLGLRHVRGKDRPDQPKPLAISTAERLAAIVEAAERAAVQVIDDAEEEARGRLEQAAAEAERLVADRLAELDGLTDSLISQAEAVRAQSEQLIASLEQARRRLAPEQDPERPERRQPDSRPSHLTAVDPVAESAAPAPTALRPAEGETTAAGARLLATQMAVSGSSREEIEARLRNGFEIEDTASIVDAILGPEE
jgi:vacuolar-type H+-ATPase subunit H